MSARPKISGLEKREGLDTACIVLADVIDQRNGDLRSPVAPRISSQEIRHAIDVLLIILREKQSLANRVVRQRQKARGW